MKILTSPTSDIYPRSRFLLNAYKPHRTLGTFWLPRDKLEAVVTERGSIYQAISAIILTYLPSKTTIRKPRKMLSC